jgi:hypothetical protein
MKERAQERGERGPTVFRAPVQRTRINKVRGCECGEPGPSEANSGCNTKGI